jgi:hypothetical protein
VLRDKGFLGLRTDGLGHINDPRNVGRTIFIDVARDSPLGSLNRRLLCLNQLDKKGDSERHSKKQAATGHAFPPRTSDLREMKLEVLQSVSLLPRVDPFRPKDDPR